jgi:hypothetical protein
LDINNIVVLPVSYFGSGYLNACITLSISGLSNRVLTTVEYGKNIVLKRKFWLKRAKRAFTTQKSGPGKLCL